MVTSTRRGRPAQTSTACRQSAAPPPQSPPPPPVKEKPTAAGREDNGDVRAVDQEDEEMHATGTTSAGTSTSSSGTTQTPPASSSTSGSLDMPPVSAGAGGSGDNVAVRRAGSNKRLRVVRAATAAHGGEITHFGMQNEQETDNGDVDMMHCDGQSSSNKGDVTSDQTGGES